MDVYDKFLYGVVSPLSMLCSGLLMVLIALGLRHDMNCIQRTHLLHIFWMAFSDFGRAIDGLFVYFYPNLGTGSIECTMRGAIDRFFINSSIGWYLIICSNIFFSIKKWPIYKSMKTKIIYHMLVWCMSMIIAIVPFQNYVQYEYGNCGFGQHGELMEYWRFVAFVPTVLAISMSLLVTTLMCCVSIKEHGKNTQKTILTRTFVFVFVFLITWLPAGVGFLLDTFIDSPRMYIVISTMVSYSNGTFNFVVWFFYFPDIQASLRHKWQIYNLGDKSMSPSFVSVENMFFLGESVTTDTVQKLNTDISSSLSVTTDYSDQLKGYS